jgi:S1-C subfamily serine protease
VLLVCSIFAFSQKPIFESVVSDDSIIKKWTKACLNIEIRPNFFVSKTWREWQIKSRTSQLDKEMVKRVQDSVRKIAYTATGIFLLYNYKHYIITSRHVLVDTSSSIKDMVFDRIFLVQNGSQTIKSKKISLDLTDVGYVDNYTSGPRDKLKYILSDAKGDLAILALDDIPTMGKQFTEMLYHKGYEPILISDIDTACQLNKGDYIISIGFPGRLSVIGRIYKDPVVQYWRSYLVTLPVIAKGYIKAPLPDSIFFKGDIFIYEGFSGGPVIRNNKLIGINRGYWGEPGNTASALLNYYFEESSIFMKSDLVMPLLRTLEQRFLNQ